MQERENRIVRLSIIGIIGKCTQKSPDKRYLTLADLILDLKKALMSPNENFVVTADSIQETKAISADEMERIKKANDEKYLITPNIRVKHHDDSLFEDVDVT